MSDRTLSDLTPKALPNSSLRLLQPQDQILNQEIQTLKEFAIWIALANTYGV